MKSNGIVRKLDMVGRLVIPKEIRKKYNMHEGDELSISHNGTYVIIRKYKSGCVFCGSNKDITKYKDLFVCKKCRQSLNE